MLNQVSGAWDAAGGSARASFTQPSDKRRVPGLRRGEVAQLAGVSIEYYTRLERGSLAGVSEAILDAVARALHLDDAERTHLLDLARAANALAARGDRRDGGPDRRSPGHRPRVLSRLVPRRRQACYPSRPMRRSQESTAGSALRTSSPCTASPSPRDAPGQEAA